MSITFTYFLPGFALYVINIFIYIQQVSKEIKTRLTYRSYNHKTVKQFSHKQFTQSVYNRILLHAVRLMRLIKCQSTKLINCTCIKFRLLVSHRTSTHRSGEKGTKYWKAVESCSSNDKSNVSDVPYKRESDIQV